MPEVLLILGTNLGDKKENLQTALRYLMEKAGKVHSVSSIYETAPWGKHSEHTYYNQALALETTLSPLHLLELIQHIEMQLGRVRQEKWGDRTLDIDILYYDDLILDEDRLKIPHPELPNRKFVLVPLSEIAPFYPHPILHKSVMELLQQTNDTGEVKKLLVL